VGAWTIDLIELTIFVDAQDAALLGLEPRAKTLTLDEITQRIHPNDRDQVNQDYEQAREQKAPYELECRFVHPDGDVRWIVGRGIFLTDDDDAVVGMAGVHIDVTNQHRVEEDLIESQRRLQTLMSNLPGMAYRCLNDPSWTMVFVSEGAEELCGHTADDLVSGQVYWNDLLHQEDRQWLWERVQEAVEEKRSFEVEYRIERADGEQRWMWEQGSGVFDGDQLVALEGFITDITARKRAEEELREVDQRKDQFLAMLGHELRNPITVITSIAETLEISEHKDPELQRIQGVLARQSTQMERLIEGLLDVSRIARGKIQLDRKTVDLRQLLVDLLEDRAAQLSARTLEVSIGDDATRLWVQVDPVRITQVFENLLMNAVKFTDPSDTITLEALAADGQVRVSVRDTGAGIEPDVLPHIFEAFQQAPPGAASLSAGLGLGLALAKGFVELHSGKIEAHSRGRGGGTEIVVHLPLVESPEQIDTTQTPQIERRQILLVEDDPDISQVLTLLLDRIGHDTRVTGTVDEGLAAAAEHHPHLVICDLGLPGMNGHEFARRVRADDTLSDLPLVALTGFGGEDVRKRALEAGFDEFLTKPVSMAQLAEVCARHCRG
jgi:PAS domain S-box-containing protein